MKYCLIVVFGCLSIVGNSFAASLVSKCNFTVNNKSNGDLITDGEGYIRFEHNDLIRMDNSQGEVLKLNVKITEVDTSPDTSALDLVGTTSPNTFYSFFNPRGTIRLGATFGNRTLFGVLNCGEPSALPYYFVLNDQEILLLNKNFQSNNLYSLLTKPTTCVDGDLSKAAQDLWKQWTLPIKNLHATAAGLEWDEIYTRCLKSEPSYDHPGSDCIESQEINNGKKYIRACQ